MKTTSLFTASVSIALPVGVWISREPEGVILYSESKVSTQDAEATLRVALLRFMRTLES